MSHPDLSEEKKLWKRGYKRVAGLDEAGRGPLAGPVAAGAVVIKNSGYKIVAAKLKEVNDSKKLSPKKREELFELIIKNKNIEWGIGIVSEKVIDKINIKNASELAMEKALSGLKLKTKNSKQKIDFLIIDGNSLNNRKLKVISHKLIIGADAKVFSVAAASIIAKVTRDRLMLKLHKKYPKYHFDIHKGYGTKIHIEMLKKYGRCKIHRRTFKPVSGFEAKNL
jgi:ribonuclease HII